MRCSCKCWNNASWYRWNSVHYLHNSQVFQDSEWLSFFNPSTCANNYVEVLFIKNNFYTLNIYFFFIIYNFMDVCLQIYVSPIMKWSKPIWLYLTVLALLFILTCLVYKYCITQATSYSHKKNIFPLFNWRKIFIYLLNVSRYLN